MSLFRNNPPSLFVVGVFVAVIGCGWLAAGDRRSVIFAGFGV